MAITRVKLENFTVFESLDLEPSPGINVLLGANGTGKTHLMKVCYAACAITKDSAFANNSHVLYGMLIRMFLPSGRNYFRMINRNAKDSVGKIVIARDSAEIEMDLSPRQGRSGLGTVETHPERGTSNWYDSPLESVFIPAKDMLANAPGFRSLYAAREVHFEETYQNILDRAYLPPLRNPAEFVPSRVLERLEEELGGKVTIHGEEFFLADKDGEIEFTLLGEGHRKLGLLWLLIRNGSLKPGAVLFWDEPETNLNPKMFKVVMEVLLELQRAGVQVFFATHDYVILKELDLQMTEEDNVAFHSLYRDKETGEIACQTTSRYLGIHHNAIDEAFTDLYDREIMRSFGGSSL